MMKKMCLLMTMFIMLFGTVCSAADWQIISSNDKGVLYLDRDSVAFDFTTSHGKVKTKFVNRKEGYILISTEYDYNEPYRYKTLYLEFYNDAGELIGTKDGDVSFHRIRDDFDPQIMLELLNVVHEHLGGK
ncbi:hypothetical protein [Selenomonas flueggei]|nr:hypothetical protein [Selenomonas flueggei]